MEETKQQKETRVILSIHENYTQLKKTCQEFIDFIKQSQPGQEIECPYIRKIENLIK